MTDTTSASPSVIQLKQTKDHRDANQSYLGRVGDSTLRLLVSVASAAEARAAGDGGADIVDAKDPFAGALGRVTNDMLRGIHTAVAGRRPVSAALGDAVDEDEIAHTARACAALGLTFVKVGLAGITSADAIVSLVAATVSGVRHTPGCEVVAVAYADWARHSSPTPDAIVDASVRAGAAGVLLDTADKQGPGLRALLEPRALARWVDRAHEAGLFVALAGKLTADDVPYACEMGADIVGVRGAACEGGRTGRVSAEHVRRLRALMRGTQGEPSTRAHY